MPEWPPGWDRTARPRRSQFSDKSLARCITDLMGEVRRMRGTNLRIDHDLQTYVKAGVAVPYSNQTRPDDCGVVVYFTLPGGKKVCWPCDRWDRPEHNLWAIVKSLEAKRALERWGAVSMDREYEGYLHLPESSGTAQEDVFAALEIPSDASAQEIKKAWRQWSLKNHPDRGGDGDRFARMSEAVSAVRRNQAEGGPNA